mgnify:FL=1
MNKLKIISSILIFLKWAGIIIGGLALVIILFIKDEPIIVESPVVSITDEKLQDQLDQMLTTTNGIHLSVGGIDTEMPISWQLRWLKVFAIITVFVYLLWILQAILNIVQDVSDKNVFRYLNIIRLKRVAWLLILAPLFSGILELIFLLVIDHTYTLPEGFTYQWSGDIDFTLLVIGFLLYAITVAFGEALKMKEEQELTI